MKRFAILLTAVALASATGSAAAASLGRQLLDLESHIQWSAVDNA
jgi:hypothetical protein